MEEQHKKNNNKNKKAHDIDRLAYCDKSWERRCVGVKAGANGGQERERN